ncbi:MAG: hypothetical protein ABH813_00950 [Patescibacteria group bacterium]
MSCSLTGISYLSVFLVLGYFVFRLFQYWKKEKNLVSKLWIYFIIFFELFLLPKAIGGMFFADNPMFLKMTIYLGAFFQAFAFAVIAALVIVIKFPRISPWLGFFTLFLLGWTAAILTILIPFAPFLEQNGTINWGLPPTSLVSVVSIMRAFLYSITFFPLIIILFDQFKNSQNTYARMKALGLGVTLLFLAITALIDFLFIGVFKLGIIWRDGSLILGSVVLFITLFLTRKTISHQNI